MKQTTRDKILKIFSEQSGYVRTKDIKAHGMHHIHLQELQDDGTIRKIKHGLYCLSDLPDYSQYSSLKEALFTIPNGVICLGTALSYYGLITWDPPEIHVAIPKSRKVKLPVYPPIRIYYFSGVFYSTGIMNETIDSGETIQIYDKEKTICDIIRYRNQIGIDIMKEALEEYLKRDDRSLNILHSYAKELRIRSILDKYLEVLL
ncbi:MAG: type IV toxin-antitoxin system AbiEi family antitoxin domain-containing protein [Spirochaetia bacterium]|nr:type IV toxin-antitoxin system AbiEi family antitoxin domain-containing protein [Spirochaetia bacterium]